MINQIEEFLMEKKGYLKKGAGVLQEVIEQQLDLEVTEEECRQAQRNIRLKLKEEYLKSDKDLTKNEYKVLIYDIETSYNLVSAWRVGYNITLPHFSVVKERAIICVSYKWLGEDEVYNLSWDKNQDDKFLLEQFIEVMNESDLMVAHNGDRFDLKWIRTRALKHGLEMLPFYQQHDTLKTAKRYFYLNSNKLDYLATFLGFEGKIPTDYELWDKIILHKDKEALKEMIEYCDEDVRQLEKVYNKLKTWDKPKQHVGVLNGLETYTSPISGSKNLELIKTRTTAAGTIKRIMKDLDTDSMFEMSNANYKKWLKG